MKTIQSIIGVLFLFFVASCDTEDENLPESLAEEQTLIETPSELPDGYFEVTFSPQPSDDTRAAISGSDMRVRSLRYVIYKSTGEYVKEKVVLTPTDPIPVWPLPAMKDTLPKGAYTAVFLANMDKTQFPYPSTIGGDPTYTEVLTNYRTTRADARILLPGSGFTDTSEYYLANVNFSNSSSHPTILLQRAISMLNLRRVFVDSQTALNSLTNNIVTNIDYRNYIQTTVQGLFPGLLKPALDYRGMGDIIYLIVGGLDAVVNMVANALLVPVTDALYNQFLQELVNQVGLTLSGNASQDGALGALGSLLNPWQSSDAAYAVVTINNFPKAMDLDLNVTDTYTGTHRFRYDFTTTPGTTNSEKDILIRGLHGQFDVRQIDVARSGLVAGLVVDELVDGLLLLDGTFVNVTDPMQATVNTNFRYRSDYSFASLGLNSYAQQTDGNHSLTLSVQLNKIAGWDKILDDIPVLGPILTSAVKTSIGDLMVTVPVNLPLLGVDNLKLSGSWATPLVQY